MTSATRKLKRKKKNLFSKGYKRTMDHFKKLVKCSICDRPPREAESIDNWHLSQIGEKINLTCDSCLQNTSPKEIP